MVRDSGYIDTLFLRKNNITTLYERKYSIEALFPYEKISIPQKIKSGWASNSWQKYSDGAVVVVLVFLFYY